MSVVEDQPFRVVVSMHVPLETLVKRSTAAFTNARTLPCYYSNNDFRFRVPPDGDLMKIDDGDHAAAVLESETEVAIVYPPIPSLVDGLRRTAADPDAWHAWYEAWSVALSSRSVTLQAATGPEGETLLSALVKPGEEAATWQNTLANLYELTWEGQRAWVIIAGRVWGGPGRLETALKEEQAKNGKVVKLARGNLFWSYTPALRGTALAEFLGKLGVTHSSVSGGELRSWDLLTKYRTEHPDGIKFLSANLVYSSATATTVMPAYDIVESGGVRAAIIGQTKTSDEKYLAQAGLGNAKIVNIDQRLPPLVAQLRPRVDVVILLGELGDFSDDINGWHRGVDLELARSDNYNGMLPPPDREFTHVSRPPYQLPLLVGRTFPSALTVWDARKTPGAHGGADWTVRERHRMLDDSIPEPQGSIQFDPAFYGISLSTETPLLPSASRIFGEPPGSTRRLGGPDFWRLAASLVAAETGSEAALMRVTDLPSNVAGDLPESLVRSWLNTGETLEVFILKGSELKPLMEEAARQKDSEEHGGGRADLRYVAAGGGPEAKIHGAPIDEKADYRVIVERVLADGLGLSAKHKVTPVKEPVDDLVLAALQKRRGAPPEQVRKWVDGRTTADRGLWTINFRDVGLNIQNTKVVRSADFNSVPNSRIQGFDELLIGETFKADAEYLQQPYRWTNTLEMEYARSRIRPRGQPQIINTTANRIMFLTTGTRRVGVIKENWFARQWGPSLGFQYDGEFEAAPGLKRKNIYSALPGVSFNDGTWVKTFEFTGNIKRDLSRDPPNTQEGLHTRLLVSKDIGPGPVNLQGELWSNYFFLSHQDTIQDLRMEGDANVKLRVPLRKFLTVSPFVDVYWFGLKTVPTWGYSIMTGIQIGFSRLWKPQFEPLLGEQ